MNYKELAQAMDIIVVYNPKSILHKIISKVTGYRAGHVALYVGDGKIYEAGSTGIVRRKWKNYNKKALVFLCRYQAMNEAIEMAIRTYCFKAEGNNYAFAQLLMMFLKYTFRLSHVPDVSKKAMICSEFVSAAYASAGIRLCDKCHDHEVSPADILNSTKIWRIECK